MVRVLGLVMLALGCLPALASAEAPKAKKPTPVSTAPMSTSDYVRDLTALRDILSGASCLGDTSWTTADARRCIQALRDKYTALIAQYETAPPPAAPTSSISANPSSISTPGARRVRAGEATSTLTWSSTNATGCTASGAWSGSKGPSGSQSVAPGSTSTYGIACTGAGGTSPVASTTVTVTTQPPPTPGVGWTELAGTALRPTCPPNGFQGHAYNFADYCRNVMLAWNGGAADTQRNRLIVVGGGHNDYYGNEPYAIDVVAGTAARITDPSPPNLPVNNTNCITTLSDGRPNSRHTYGAVEYIAHRDELLLIGGSVACGPGWFTSDIWTYAFGSQQWTRRTPAGPQPLNDAGTVTVYHPTTRKVYVHDRQKLLLYDPDANTMTLVMDTPIDYHMSGTIDTKRNMLILIGGPLDSLGGAWIYDLTAKTRQQWSAGVRTAMAPGVAYDPGRDKVAIWDGGATIYWLDMDTRTLTPEVQGGDLASAATSNGIFGRFRFFPALGLFAGVTDMSFNTFILASGSTPPPITTPPSAALSASPTSITAGQAATLTWSSTNATGCTASGAWSGTKPTAGTQSVTPTSSSTYSMVCTGAGGTSPSASATVAVGTTPPPNGGGAIKDLPPGIMHTLNPPTQEGTGVALQTKHVTWTYHPPSGRLYSVGGDFSGASYRQDTYSLSLADRWASKANVTAGWRQETPTCDATGGVQPKHPDYVGFPWDAKRGVFWMTPGTMVSPYHVNCTGETDTSSSDAKYKFREVMTFNPTTKAWALAGIPYQAAMVSGDTWKAHYDPPTDSLYQFGWSGASGGTMNILNVGTKALTTINLGINAARQDIRVFKEGSDMDPQARVIYAVDGVANRLMAFDIATRQILDLGASPGAGTSDNNNALVAWDTKRSVLYYWSSGTNELYVYTPATKAWSKPPQASSDGSPVRVRHGFIYDPGADVLALLGSTEEAPKLFFYRLPAPARTAPAATGRGPGLHP